MDSSLISELEHLLEDQLEALEILQAILAREKELLLSGGEKDIGQVAGEKERALDRLTQSAQALDAYLARAGFEGGADGLAQCIERASDAGELSELHAQVNEELRACAQLNESNGAILESNRAASERALRVLLSTQRHPDCYHESGRLENSGFRQTLGKA